MFDHLYSVELTAVTKMLISKFRQPAFLYFACPEASVAPLNLEETLKNVLLSENQINVPPHMSDRFDRTSTNEEG